MSATMEINPSTLTNRADSSGPAAGSGATGGTPGPSKPPPIITNGASGKGAAKPTQSLPRVDIEPMYAALKASIGDHWATYKDAVSRFILGFLNQDELCRATQHFIAVDPSREHLHNQLLCAILANVVRDPPEAGVASWVSANDKPTSVTKPVTGNAAEQRLKHEVMQLPPRFRHRIKSVKDEPRQPLTHALTVSSQSRRLPGSADRTSTPLSATHPPTPTTGLNKDLEIRRRYNAPLISETHDLPSGATLAERVLPICYEEGLTSGAAAPPLVGELLGTALEFFVKESLASLLAPTRANAALSDPAATSTAAAAAAAAASSATTTTSTAPQMNGAPAPPLPIAAPPPSQPQPQKTAPSNSNGAPGESLPDGALASAVGISTASYKRRVAHEAAAARRGDLKRNEAGLLPAEVAAQGAQAHGRGMAGDLRLGWDTGEPWLTGMMPWLGERLYAFDEMEFDDDAGGGHGAAAEAGLAVTAPAAAAAEGGAVVVNGDAGADEPPDDMMAIDEADWGWQGGKEGERRLLGSLLDDCLTVAG